MGAGASAPVPPPRLAKMETVSFAGDPDPIPSTMRIMDLPPAITQTAREGIRLCAGLRRHYIFSAETDADERSVEKTLSQLDDLTRTAKSACNIRDYVILLIEVTILRLSMDLGPPREDLIEAARFINPFLHARSGGEDDVAEGSRVVLEPFRSTDGALITDSEKDLLVLLYYCHASNISDSPDEAIDHMGKMADKYGVITDLNTRKEPFTETEVYIFWSLIFLAYNLSDINSQKLIPTSRARLQSELGISLSRLLTVCEMLATLDGRLDQACFLLMFLRRLVAREERTWWKSRTKHLGKEITKNRPGRQKWHVEFAARTVKGLAKHPENDPVESWEGRGSLSLSRESLGLNSDIWKGV